MKKVFLSCLLFFIFQSTVCQAEGERFFIDLRECAKCGETYFAEYEDHDCPRANDPELDDPCADEVLDSFLPVY